MRSWSSSAPRCTARDAGAITGETEEERITLREEEVDVSKRTVAKEAVAVGKRTVTGTETVDANLKEEEIVVEGATETAGGTATATRRSTSTATDGVTGQVDGATGVDEARPNNPR